MREVLFRGKEERYGNWIEGYYCPCCFGYFPCKPAIIEKAEMDNGCWKPAEVLPETVGQHTGLHDTNGERIFEGDIVDISISDLKRRGCVFYSDRAARWGVVLQNSEENFSFLQQPLVGMYVIKVIGNIHDNPELLNKQ